MFSPKVAPGECMWSDFNTVHMYTQTLNIGEDIKVQGSFNNLINKTPLP